MEYIIPGPTHLDRVINMSNVAKMGLIERIVEPYGITRLLSMPICYKCQFWCLMCGLLCAASSPIVAL